MTLSFSKMTGRIALTTAASALAMMVATGGPAYAASAHDDSPRKMDPNVKPSEHDADVFKADPTYEEKAYDAERQLEIYGGKRNIEEPRPILEVGRPQYVEGPFDEGINVVGEKNLLFPSFSVFGDFRTAVAANDVGGDVVYEFANRLNLDLDLKLTGTERIHGFFRPIDQNGKFMGYRTGDKNGNNGVDGKFDANPETLFFEGDIGAIYGGLADEYATFDLPIAFGLTPFVMQNGLWVDDAFIGGGISLAALNSPALDITNMDITFFGGFNEIDSPAFVGRDGVLDTNDVSIYAVAAFVEWFEGYSEFGIGYVDGRDLSDDIDYVNFTGAFTSRYGGWLSNSVRLFGAVGQDTDVRSTTANGFALLVENSLITSKPDVYVPYFNAWVGIDKPQSLARNNGGLLKNTGITFENDGMTSFPKLDDTAQDTFGGAIGINYLFSLDQQLVVEASTVQTLAGDEVAGQPAQGAQYGLGFRYQIPVTNRVILRADGIYGIRENEKDIGGVRFEVRVKF
ncbi:MAG: hypothetical protein HOJ21_11190 [Alphaproteobacteria bacterium]|nr:hypothetical protein [Alphaproteobacteria bacterium]